MLYLRSLQLSVLFFFNLICLSAQITNTQMKDPWDDPRYRQPAAVRGPLDDPRVRDFVINQSMLVPTDQPVNRPISSTVSIGRLKHHVPAKARNELARSEQQFRRGHLQSSVEHLKKAIAIDPDYMEAHNNLGARYIALGNNEMAVDHLQTALRLDPSSALAQLNVGLALYSLKRVDQAEQYARNAIRLTPGFPKAHYLLGLILGAEGKNTAEAVEHFQKSAVEFPKAHLLAGRSLLACGAVGSAASEFRQYLAWPQAENREQIEQWLAAHQP